MVKEIQQMDQIYGVAQLFSKVLRLWLTKDEMKEVNRLNKTENYKIICASHEFCDSNIAMNEAFKKIMLRKFDHESDYDLAIWNGAWEKAKEKQFYTS